MKKYALYYSKYCYFCQKVLMRLYGKQHSIELLDVSDPQNLQALNDGGGKTQVPCLMIEEDDGAVTWLYESDDILHYINSNNLI